MSVKPSLGELEARVREELIEQLSAIVRRLEKKGPSLKLIDELELAVKICHQVRSLDAKPL